MRAQVSRPHRRVRHGFASLLTLATALTAGTAWAGPAAEAKPEPLVLCLALAPDDSPIFPIAEVRADFRGFAVACHVAEGESLKALTATWVALEVGSVAPKNTVIATTTLEIGTRGHGGFSFSLPRDLPVGSYRVDVQADGKAWASLPVSVVAATDVALPAKPADLLPLAKGTAWTYDFRLTPGPGVTLTLPGVTPDADGTLRAKAVYAVAQSTGTSARVEIRRNEAVVLEESWALDAKGLGVTRRHAGDETMDFDPPQPLFPWPVKGATTSTYTPKGGDASAAQGVRTWGPVTVAGPSGPATGWVVLVSVPVTSPSITIEREFVPGVGMVRESIVRAGQMLFSRQETVLVASK